MTQASQVMKNTCQEGGSPGWGRPLSVFSSLLTVAAVVSLLTVGKLYSAIVGSWSSLLGCCRKTTPPLVTEPSKCVDPGYSIVGGGISAEIGKMLRLEDNLKYTSYIYIYTYERTM